MDQTIENFLKKPEIQVILKKIERKRKTVLTLVSLFTLFLLCTFFLIEFPLITKDNYLENITENLEVLLGIFAINYGIYTLFSRDLDPRRKIIPEFAKLIDKNLFYEYSTASKPEWLINEKMIGSYERIEFIHNHIKYSSQKNIGNSIIDVNIEGFEIQTSKGRGKNKIYPCHAYITKIDFSGNNFSLEKDVWVVKDKGSFRYHIEKSDFKNKNQTPIMLESSEFEKMFDVYGEDQVEARDLLNPHTMETLINFVKSMNGDRFYDFLFTNNLIYIITHYSDNDSNEFLFTRIKMQPNLAKDKKLYIGFYNEFIKIKKFSEDFEPFYRR